MTQWRHRLKLALFHGQRWETVWPGGSYSYFCGTKYQWCMQRASGWHGSALQPLWPSHFVLVMSWCCKKLQKSSDVHWKLPEVWSQAKGRLVSQVEWAWHRAIWPWPSLEVGKCRGLWKKASYTLWVVKSCHWDLKSTDKTEHCFPKGENLPARVTHSQLDSQAVFSFPPSPTLLPALCRGLSEHPGALGAVAAHLWLSFNSYLGSDWCSSS